ISLVFLAFVFFETLFQIAQRLKAMAFVFANPALGDLVNRHWIEIMQLLPPAPNGSDEVRLFQNDEMFGHSLPRHVAVRAQFAERLPVVLVQLIEQFPTTFVSQCFEHCIHLAGEYATKWLHVKECFRPLPRLCAVRESQRESVPKPRVARNALPWVIVQHVSNRNAVCGHSVPVCRFDYLAGAFVGAEASEAHTSSL